MYGEAWECAQRGSLAVRVTKAANIIRWQSQPGRELLGEPRILTGFCELGAFSRRLGGPPALEEESESTSETSIRDTWTSLMADDFVVIQKRHCLLSGAL